MIIYLLLDEEGNPLGYHKPEPVMRAEDMPQEFDFIDYFTNPPQNEAIKAS